MVDLEKYCRHLRIPKEVEKEVKNPNSTELIPGYRGIRVKYETETGSTERSAECVYLTAKINEGSPTACKRRLKTMKTCPLKSIDFPIVV